MPLSRTAVHSEDSGSVFGTGAFTTASFTPPSNSLLVVIVYVIENAGNDTDVGTQLSISGGGLTYTRRITVDDPVYWTSGLVAWTAPISTASSMTLTLDCGAYNIDKYKVSVLAYTGYDTTTPTGATASANSGVTDGAETLTLSGSPAADSEVVAAMGAESVNPNNSITVGTGWTEVHQVVPSGSYNVLQTQVRTGSTSTSVGWDDVSVDAGGLYQNIRLALEIKAAAGGGGANNQIWLITA